jgi:hypothetical protein
MYSKYVEASQTAKKKDNNNKLNGKLEMERPLDLIKLKSRAPNFENHITVEPRKFEKGRTRQRAKWQCVTCMCSSKGIVILVVK